VAPAGKEKGSFYKKRGMKEFERGKDMKLFKK